MRVKVDYYVSENNKAPFLEWVDRLDITSQLKVDRVIQRVAQGGAKKSVKSLKDGIFEIKIPHGPGLRVYFGRDGDRLILLLVGGDKGTQSKDIKRAKQYWSAYGKQK